MSEQNKLSMAVLDTCVQTSTSLLPPQTMDYDTWEKAFMTLDQANKSLQWWLGDLVIFGETNFGEKYTQAIEVTEYDEGYIRNIVWVCNRIKPQHRREELTFTHHLVAANGKLSEEQMEQCLEVAVNEKMSVADLRTYIRELLNETTPVGAVNYKEGMKEIRGLVDDVAISAVPSKEDIQRMTGLITSIKKCLDVYGIKEGE